jgi:hypothetical protein
LDAGTGGDAVGVKVREFSNVWAAGMRTTDVIGAILGVAFLGAIGLMLIPARTREKGGRSYCATNLRGTVQSMNVYASDNSDMYPIVSSKGGYALAAAGSGVAGGTPEATLRSMYGAGDVPSVTQNMWLLVLTGAVSPKQFICRQDMAPKISAMTTVSAPFPVNFVDANGRRSDFAYSYSFAYPWESTPDAKVGEWWKNRTDAELPLISDMSPLAGTGKPAATPADPTRREANSFNHNRDGQNVGYGDAHAEFTRAPSVGQKDDNIFTFNRGVTSKTGTAFTGGVPDVGTGGSPGAFDICLVPAADGDTFARR